MKPLTEAKARAAVRAAFMAVRGDDVRVVLHARDGGFARWAVNEITTSGVVRDVVAHVTCSVGQRHATVTVHGAEPARLADAARRAIDLAKLLPEDPEWVPDVGVARTIAVPAAWSETTAAVTPADRGALVADAIGVAKKRGLQSSGFLTHDTDTTVVATRRGFFGVHHDTGITLTTTARTEDGTGSGWAEASGVRPEDVDVHAASSLASDKALATAKARALEPGVYPVVLEPAAVSDLMGWMIMALDARAADEGRSAFAKPGGGTRVGEKLFGGLTLKSDPSFAQLPTAPFDDEGMVRPPVSWVDDGVLKKLRVSRYWGKRTGRPADASVRALIANGGHSTTEQMISTMDRGLVVTRLWYIRMLEPQKLSVTGLTRDGVMLVEKGKIVGPVNNFRFNQSIPEMFAACDAYGPAKRVELGEHFAAVAPSVRCAKFHMSSKSDAV